MCQPVLPTYTFLCSCSIEHAEKQAVYGYWDHAVFNVSIVIDFCSSSCLLIRLLGPLVEGPVLRGILARPSLAPTTSLA